MRLKISRFTQEEKNLNKILRRTATCFSVDRAKRSWILFKQTKFWTFMQLPDFRVQYISKEYYSCETKSKFETKSKSCAKITSYITSSKTCRYLSPYYSLLIFHRTSVQFFLQTQIINNYYFFSYKSLFISAIIYFIIIL